MKILVENSLKYTRAGGVMFEALNNSTKFEATGVEVT